MQVKYNDLVGEPRRKWLWRVLTSRNPVKRAFAAVIKRILLCLPQEPTRKVLEPVFRRLIDMRRSEMMEQTRMKLVRGFSDDIRRLEALIGRDLSHWRGGA
jgi:hypothetical protein